MLEFLGASESFSQGPFDTFCTLEETEVLEDGIPESLVAALWEVAKLLPLSQL